MTVLRALYSRLRKSTNLSPADHTLCLDSVSAYPFQPQHSHRPGPYAILFITSSAATATATAVGRPYGGSRSDDISGLFIARAGPTGTNPQSAPLQSWRMWTHIIMDAIDPAPTNASAKESSHWAKKGMFWVVCHKCVDHSPPRQPRICLC